ncbi:MAG: hypothetical protein HY295_04130, partial [Thaumarchaeota archaeon]|nr:hypothetical protein [Nitrososphaerota archaeon]
PRDTVYHDALQIVKPKTIAPDSEIPVWVKTNAKWWSEGKIGDSEFVNGVQYLIQKGIMKVPSTTSAGTSASKQIQIPDWVKNNAEWWSEDLISENDFVHGIQWLITNGIIAV